MERALIVLISSEKEEKKKKRKECEGNRDVLGFKNGERECRERIAGGVDSSSRE